MIRSVCMAMAVVSWFAGTLAAQPLSSTRSLLDSSEMRLVSPAAAETETAQPSDQQPAGTFEELARRVRAGDTVHVVDAADEEISGRVATLSDTVLTLTVDGIRREFAADDIRRIDRQRRDSVRNGVLKGAGAGAALGFAIGRSADSPSCPRSGIECGQGSLIGTVGGAFWGAVGGWIVDALIRKREIIYRGHGG